MEDSRKLKILFVMQSPWGSGLGIARVHFELKNELEKLGHKVDVLDHSVIYPKGENLRTHLLGKSTQYRFLDYLKKYAYKYDVIDANQRCIPFPKDNFNFKGLLLYRSHGLQPLYRIAEYAPSYKKMSSFRVNSSKKLSLKNHLGNLKRYLLSEEGDWATWMSLFFADIVHCLNNAEFDYLVKLGIPAEKLKIVPNGIKDEYSKQDKVENVEVSEISFIGSWTLRKGIIHLPPLVQQLEGRFSRLNLLGTGASSEVVLKDFKENTEINVVNNFNAENLSQYLNQTKVAIFPSYAEGFGLAVVEFLALGIPVVAFDIPGPSDILKPLQSDLLIELGNEQKFIKRVEQILRMENDGYLDLSNKCLERAEVFKYSKIAKQFEAIYKNNLDL